MIRKDRYLRRTIVDRHKQSVPRSPESQSSAHSEADACTYLRSSLPPYRANDPQRRLSAMVLRRHEEYVR
jgi:hypothetical protein